MSEDVLLTALLAAAVLLAAWRDHIGGNRRDARLLAALGSGGMLASAAVWMA